MPVVGAEAWDFTLQDVKGASVTLSDLRGKPVMIAFWASWCGPCRLEIPHITALYSETGGEAFEVLAVNVREDAGRVQRFSTAYEMTFPVLRDPDGAVSEAYFVRGLPTSIFVDEQGIIRDIHTGTLDDVELRQYIGDLVPSLAP